MKFSLFSLSCCVHLSLSARPVSVSHDEADIGNNSTQHSHCNGHPAKSDAANRCKQPGHNGRDNLLCHKCGWFRKDTHPLCRIECCDRGRLRPHGKCECTPRGQPFNMGHPAHIVGGNTAEKCCGKDHRGHPTVEGDKCGCGLLGTYTHYGGHGSDCCSGRCDQWNRCIKRECTKKGGHGRCCRVATDHTHPLHQHNAHCKCFPAGSKPNENDNVDWKNCCSGHADASGSACACIAEHTKLPSDATAADCCTGKKEGEYCQAAKCKEVGETPTGGGDHCCSGEAGDICKCLASGKDLPAKASSRDCCSGKEETKEGKRVCAWLSPGEELRKDATAKQVCRSGLKTSSNTCRCIHKGVKTTKEAEKHCCSGALATGKDFCGCVPTGDVVPGGGKDTNCCTGVADDEGECLCGAPGSPVLGFMNPSKDCCARETKVGEKFCGCIGHDHKNTNVTKKMRGHCCGGSYNYNGHNCTCVDEGFAIGSWAHEKACCSGKFKDSTTHVCAKS